VVVTQQFAAGTGQDNAAGLQYIGPVGDFQGLEDVLFNQQNGNPLPIYLLNNLKTNFNK